VAVDPSGKFAYVANFTSHDVWAYTINALTGALTSVGAPVAAGNAPHSIGVDPSGRFAYVANNGSNDVSAFSIDAVTGVLTSIGAPAAAGTGPRFITTTGTWR
jgi:6-phosphogluconolactonase (cycloisomerase 2 family)